MFAVFFIFGMVIAAIVTPGYLRATKRKLLRALRGDQQVAERDIEASDRSELERQLEDIRRWLGSPDGQEAIRTSQERAKVTEDHLRLERRIDPESLREPVI